MSQGQAIRSIFGRARVTQTVRPCGIPRRKLGLRAPSAGRPRPTRARRPRASPPGCPQWRSQAATPWLSFSPFWQMTTAERPGELRRPVGDRAEGAADRARDQARVGGEVLVGLDIDEGRAIGPCRSGAASLSGEMVLIDDMDASSLKESWTRCLGMSPRGEIAVPMPEITSSVDRSCQGSARRPIRMERQCERQRQQGRRQRCRAMRLRQSQRLVHGCGRGSSRTSSAHRHSKVHSRRESRRRLVSDARKSRWTPVGNSLRHCRS